MRASTNAPRILIVEDDERDAGLMKSLLDTLGCDVVVAMTFQDAENKLFETTTHPLSFFDLIFLDLNLPDKPGSKLLRVIRKLVPSVPVVIVTGYAQSEMLQEASRSGYIGLVEKPLQASGVMEIFQKHRIAIPSEANAI